MTFSRAVSQICLPIKDDLDVLERKENILIGFGASKRLIGGKLESASLIPPKKFLNNSSLISAFTED